MTLRGTGLEQLGRNYSHNTTTSKLNDSFRLDSAHGLLLKSWPMRDARLVVDIPNMPASRLKALVAS